MGWGDLVAEAVESASNDMSRVQGAADAIEGAVSKAQGLLDPQTWLGQPAQAWIGNWMGTYKTLLSCLNGLPNAEASVVVAVRSQMEKIAQEHASQPAPS
jgi:hypothetical protein